MKRASRRWIAGPLWWIPVILLLFVPSAVATVRSNDRQDRVRDEGIAVKATWTTDGLLRLRHPALGRVVAIAPVTGRPPGRTGPVTARVDRDWPGRVVVPGEDSTEGSPLPGLLVPLGLGAVASLLAASRWRRAHRSPRAGCDQRGRPMLGRVLAGPLGRPRLVLWPADAGPGSAAVAAIPLVCDHGLLGQPARAVDAIRIGASERPAAAACDGVVLVPAGRTRRASRQRLPGAPTAHARSRAQPVGLADSPYGQRDESVGIRVRHTLGGTWTMAGGLAGVVLLAGALVGFGLLVDNWSTDRALRSRGHLSAATVVSRSGDRVALTLRPPDRPARSAFETLDPASFPVGADVPVWTDGKRIGRLTPEPFDVMTPLLAVGAAAWAGARLVAVAVGRHRRRRRANEPPSTVPVWAARPVIADPRRLSGSRTEAGSGPWLPSPAGVWMAEPAMPVPAAGGPAHRAGGVAAVPWSNGDPRVASARTRYGGARSMLWLVPAIVLLVAAPVTEARRTDRLVDRARSSGVRVPAAWVGRDLVTLRHPAVGGTVAAVPVERRRTGAPIATTAFVDRSWPGLVSVPSGQRSSELTPAIWVALWVVLAGAAPLAGEASRRRWAASLARWDGHVQPGLAQVLPGGVMGASLAVWVADAVPGERAAAVVPLISSYGLMGLPPQPVEVATRGGRLRRSGFFGQRTRWLIARWGGVVLVPAGRTGSGIRRPRLRLEALPPVAAGRRPATWQQISLMLAGAALAVGAVAGVIGVGRARARDADRQRHSRLAAATVVSRSPDYVVVVRVDGPGPTPYGAFVFADGGGSRPGTKLLVWTDGRTVRSVPPRPYDALTPVVALLAMLPASAAVGSLGLRGYRAAQADQRAASGAETSPAG
ncbi:MAG: hypothetical protein HYX34_14025 [Actinobacteria bacterium]|nr:hypothetical protein [Actinomycetota bacterium]